MHWHSYNLFILYVVVKVSLDDVHVSSQYFDDGLCKALHVTLHNFRIRAFELLNDIKALRQLGEYVHHRV